MKKKKKKFMICIYNVVKTYNYTIKIYYYYILYYYIIIVIYKNIKKNYNKIKILMIIMI